MAVVSGQGYWMIPTFFLSRKSVTSRERGKFWPRMWTLQ
jgi:hypothetical protein